MAKKGLKIDGNFAGASAYNGYVSGVSDVVKTTAYIGSVVEYVHGSLAPMFDSYMDAVAKSAPGQFHHVYEWPKTYIRPSENTQTVGNPSSRLWYQTLRGSGRTRSGSFVFLASKVPSPVNPILTEPGKNGRSVNKGVHIFFWKAPAFEYGWDITVEPKMAKFLAYVNEDRGGGGNDSGSRAENSQGITFSKGPVNFVAGGGHNVGNFTGVFKMWWSQIAPGEYIKFIKPRLESDIADRQKVGIIANRANARGRSKDFSIAASTRSFKEGSDAARAIMMKNQRDYIAGARVRRLQLYGY